MRLPILRITHIGISALLLQERRIAAETGLGEETIFAATVPVIGEVDTLFQNTGDVTGKASLLAALLLIAASA